MARLDKESAAYLDGMEHALRICEHISETSKVTEALRMELTYRRGEHRLR